MKGFPRHVYPRGWFQLGWSGQIGELGVASFAFFGRDLVAYRGKSGQVHVLDAHCAHMGAHLGCGGQVRAEDIVCPFHGWSYDGSGTNVDIPYSSQLRAHRVIRSWPSYEADGIIFIWHDEDGAEPLWPVPMPHVPENDDPGYFPIYPACVSAQPLAAVPQLLPENTVDVVHARYVHQWADIPVLEQYGAEAHVFRSHISGMTETRRGLVPTSTRMESWGLGLVLSRHLWRFSQGAGSGSGEPDRDTVLLVGMTPTSLYECICHVTVWTGKPSGWEGQELSKRARAVVDASFSEVFEADGAIWSSMEYVRNPPFTREEARAQSQVRRWADQFYPAESAAASLTPSHQPERAQLIEEGVPGV